MGFITQTATTTLTAKLTPYGRQQLLTNSSSIITKFSLGDSDANYYGDIKLPNGSVPDMAGEIGPNGTFSNGIYSGVDIASPLVVNDLGDIKKNIEAGSNSVVITPITNGITTLDGNSLTELITDRMSGATDANVNLFHTFGLPITQDDKDLYTTFTSPTGYLDTAIRNLNQDKILVMAIDACEYGEIIDGKTIKIELATNGGAIANYTIYSTFEKSLTPATTVDAQVKEVLALGSAVGKNIAFLFSDEVQRPNSGTTTSWATGYNLSKPFSLNGKHRYNPYTVSSSNTIMDSAIGVVYLDRGIIVITHPDIVDNYDVNSSASTITYNHISNEVAQNITCVVERHEFASTTNRTHSDGDEIRVSEVVLYDNSNNVIAFAKSNEHVIIGANQFMALGVRIFV